MSREGEIEELKGRVKAIKARLASLEMRIGNARGIESMPLPWKAVVDFDRCVGCGSCESVCPTGAINIEGQAHVNAEKCTGCGHCVQECPKGALTLQPVRILGQTYRPFEGSFQHVG